MTVHVRYKLPDDNASVTFNTTLKNEMNSFENAAIDFRFAAAVAQYAMLLRNSKYKGTSTLQKVIATAENAKGNNENGCRKAFVQMVKATVGLVKE